MEGLFPARVYGGELRLSYQTVKHSFMAVMVHFPYFIPREWEKTVAALLCCGGPKLCFFAALTYFSTARGAVVLAIIVL